MKITIYIVYYYILVCTNSITNLYHNWLCNREKYKILAPKNCWLSIDRTCLTVISLSTAMLCIVIGPSLCSLSLGCVSDWHWCTVLNQRLLVLIYYLLNHSVSAMRVIYELIAVYTDLNWYAYSLALTALHWRQLSHIRIACISIRHVQLAQALWSRGDRHSFRFHPERHIAIRTFFSNSRVTRVIWKSRDMVISS